MTVLTDIQKAEAVGSKKYIKSAWETMYLLLHLKTKDIKQYVA